MVRTGSALLRDQLGTATAVNKSAVNRLVSTPTPVSRQPLSAAPIADAAGQKTSQKKLAKQTSQENRSFTQEQTIEFAAEVQTNTSAWSYPGRHYPTLLSRKSAVSRRSRPSTGWPSGRWFALSSHPPRVREASPNLAHHGGGGGEGHGRGVTKGHACWAPGLLTRSQPAVEPALAERVWAARRVIVAGGYVLLPVRLAAGGWSAMADSGRVQTPGTGDAQVVGGQGLPRPCMR